MGALYFLVRVIVPRIRSQQNTSGADDIINPTFFGGISQFNSPDDYAAYLKEIASNEDQLYKMFAGQVFALGKINQKKNDQPTNIKTCGSTFKNPENKKAWELIKNSGCAGIKVGDACISEKHCNFFVNKGNAKSSDFENLIYKVKNKVLDKTGIDLQLELQIIGKKS